jgi:hypothetical protein
VPAEPLPARLTALPALDLLARVQDHEILYARE